MTLTTCFSSPRAMDACQSTSSVGIPQQLSRFEIVRYVQVFQPHLTSVWARTRTPYGFDKACTEARSLPDHTTARIFFDVGLVFFLSYYLISRPTGKHYKGRHAIKETVRSLDQLAVSDRKAITAELSKTNIHPTVRDAVRKIISRQSRKSQP